jgi:hypothetical protein
MQHMSRTLPIMGAPFKQNPASPVKPEEGLSPRKSLRYSESTGTCEVDGDYDDVFGNPIPSWPSLPSRGDASVPIGKPV